MIFKNKNFTKKTLKFIILISDNLKTNFGDAFSYLFIRQGLKNILKPFQLKAEGDFRDFAYSK